MQQSAAQPADPSQKVRWSAEGGPEPERRGSGGRKGWIAALAVLLLAAAALAVALIWSGSGKQQDAADSLPASSQAQSTSAQPTAEPSPTPVPTAAPSPTPAPQQNGPEGLPWQAMAAIGLAVLLAAGWILGRFWSRHRRR